MTAEAERAIDDWTSLVWHIRAERLLEEALEGHRNGEGDEALISASAALAALRIDRGELPADELDGYPFPGEPPDESGCICPPEMLQRGGFKGRCPVHGAA